MDENDWLESVDPRAVFEYVSDRIDQRKRRLLACACVRSVWDNLRDERFRQIVELSEEVADGRYGIKRLEEMRRSLSGPGVDFSGVLTEPSVSAKAAAYQLGNTSFTHQAIHLSLLSAAPCIPRRDTEGFVPPDPVAKQTHSRHLADLFRDIIGNPFRPVSLHPDWLAWDDGTVGQLAETIYVERRYQDLPVLADALEDAGCDEPEILDHLRGPGVHARGCWALDLARGV